MGVSADDGTVYTESPQHCGTQSQTTHTNTPATHTHTHPRNICNTHTYTQTRRPHIHTCTHMHATLSHTNTFPRPPHPTRTRSNSVTLRQRRCLGPRACLARRHSSSVSGSMCTRTDCCYTMWVVVMKECYFVLWGRVVTDFFVRACVVSLSF